MKRIPLKSKSPDEDFSGLLEDWDDRVFRHADHFRVHRYYGNGSNDRMETKDFGQAMCAADACLKTPGMRVLVYAVTATGRYQCLVQTRWEHYAQLWLDKRSMGEQQ